MNGIRKLLIFISCCCFLVCCNSDIKDATFKGKILDSLLNPITNCEAKVISAYYEGGDNVGYNGYDTIYVKTDTTGSFSIKLDRSAYVSIFVKKFDFHYYIIKRETYKEIILSK